MTMFCFLQSVLLFCVFFSFHFGKKRGREDVGIIGIIFLWEVWFFFFLSIPLSFFSLFLFFQFLFFFPPFCRAGFCPNITHRLFSGCFLVSIKEMERIVLNIFIYFCGRDGKKAKLETKNKKQKNQKNDALEMNPLQFSLFLLSLALSSPTPLRNFIEKNYTNFFSFFFGTNNIKTIS